MQNSRTKSEAGLLVLVVFLLGLLVGGVGYRLWGSRVFGDLRDAHGGPPSGRGPQGPSFSERMGLSPAQQKQLDAIFSNFHPQFQALDEQYRSQRKALGDQVRQQMRAILTPDQQAKFDAMVKDQEAHGRGPNHGPGPGGPGGPGGLGPGGAMRLGPPDGGQGSPNQAPNQAPSQPQGSGQH
jgi:hypothetical protein